MTSFVKGYFRGIPHRPAYIKTHEQLRSEVRLLNRIRIKAPSRWAEPLDGEEFDDLSDERKQQMRESM
jgi:hypothetical protein